MIAKSIAQEHVVVNWDRSEGKLEPGQRRLDDLTRLEIRAVSDRGETFQAVQVGEQ
jgi:hypothetical protein